jgi:F-type H+-transporting ATPase subunit delta
MSEPRINAYAEAVLSVGLGEGQLSQVEDELFRFGQVYESSDELRTTLSDPHLPVARRQQIVEDVLEGKVSDATRSLVSLMVANGRAADIPAVSRAVTHRAASGRGEAVAEVRSAVALSDDQVTRLASKLSTTTGMEITVRNIVDPSVIGGVVTTIGDDVLDGSVRTRLNRLRDAF